MWDKLDLLFSKVMDWEGNSPSRQAFIAAMVILGFPCLISCTVFIIATSLGCLLFLVI